MKLLELKELIDKAVLEGYGKANLKQDIKNVEVIHGKFLEPEVVLIINNDDLAEKLNSEITNELIEALKDITFIFESLSDKVPTPVNEFKCYQKAKQVLSKIK